MTIALVDDDRLWLRKAESAFLKYAQNNNIDLEVLCFESGDALLNYGEKTVDAAFVDIVLGDKNGIDLATVLNDQWPDCQIIYCTDFMHYAMDVYETKHIWFLVKSQFEDRLDRIMNKLFNIERMEKQELYYHVIREGMTRFILRDIIYFERKTRFTLLVTTHGKYHIREKITEVLKDLPKGDFTRCHASFTVNLSYIDHKNRSSYELKNGESVPISRSFSADTKRDYLQWCAEQME